MCVIMTRTIHVMYDVKKKKEKKKKARVPAASKMTT